MTARQLATVIAILILSAEARGAASLLDYEKRVFRAAEQVERIKADSDYADEAVDYIKRLLPRSEPVEIEGREVEVDNSWLHALMDSYKAESDSQRRASILDEAGGGLKALDEHLRLFEGDVFEGAPQNAGSENPRERIRHILERQEYGEKVEHPVAAFLKDVRRRVLVFLGDLLSRIFNTLFGAASTADLIVKGMVIIALLLSAMLVVRMLKKKRPASKRVKKRVVLGEEIEEGLTSKELAERAFALARVNDYRGAIRKLYVSLLYELAERNLIELEASATNRDYLARVAHIGALATPMRYLTDRFDYFWYGMIPSTSEEFLVFRARYDEAIEGAQRLTGSRT